MDDGTHRTEADGFQATWRLNHLGIGIMFVRNLSDASVLASFDAGDYPDLVRARELFPALANLWDAVRREFWAEFIPPQRRSRPTHFFGHGRP